MGGMDLDGDTRLKDVLAEYPWIKDELSGINSKFRILLTPMGKLMIDKVTLGYMAARSEIPVEDLTGALRRLIDEREKNS